MINIDPSDALPIWKQIEEEIRRLITIGRLEPGTSVPSVRDLAREIQVNPATVSRAYQRLTDANVLVVRRGEGTYVSESIPSQTRTERRRALRDAAATFAVAALAAGASPDEALEAVETALARLQPAAAGGKR